MSPKPEPETSRAERTRAFWDAHTRWNPLLAIYDSDQTRDPERGERAFWDAGEGDARRLAWFFAPGARVVELGCGIGRILRWLAPRCGEIVGVDVSEEMLVRAREALAHVPNVRLVRTDGASLRGIEDGSVDFLYSLLVLIHVDRRSAFRYLEELPRVLAPGGLAFLQFQNVACPEGIAKLRSVLDGDYPLEFYTREELDAFFGAAGLSVVASFAEREFLFYTLTAGDAEAWRARIARSVRAVEAAPEPSGSLRVTLRSALARVQPFLLELGVTRGAALVHHAGVVIDLAPGDHVLEVRRAAPDEDPTAALDGAPLDLRSERGAAAEGPARHHVALLPPGFRSGPAHAAAFPGLVHSWPR